MKIEPIPLLRDNYAWLLTTDGTRECAVVDPSDSGPVLNLLQERDLTLQTILATHHHWDHVNGIEGLLAHFNNVDVICSRYDYENERVPGANQPKEDGDELVLFDQSARCMLVPGHTLGAMAFYFESASAVFTGDTLFTAGCGRLFEGTPKQMHDSLLALAQLPKETLVYCGHEYTESNLNFAMTVEPENRDVVERLTHVKELRRTNKPTVPASIGEELQTNPFMRAARITLGDLVGKDSPVEVFAELRSQKDKL